MRRRKEAAAPDPTPVAPPPPVTPLPDPQGATVQARIEKAREKVAKQAGRTSFTLAGSKPQTAARTARPRALGAGY